MSTYTFVGEDRPDGWTASEIKTKRQTLSDYLADYLDQEYRDRGVDDFWDWLPDIIEEGLEAYRGGAGIIEET